ncbi:MAG: hypothetical protein ACR2PJ_05645, partial [Pseudomonadales bacterium]
LEQETDFVSLVMTWDMNSNFTLTSVTGWVDLYHWELDDYSYGGGIFGGLHNNVYESFSEELRIASNLDGPFNLQAGFLIQEVEQVFDAYQYAANLGLGGPSTGPTAAAPRAVAGNEYDYNKIQFLDTDVLSFFMAFYWDLTDRTELTLGARYTKEEKDGRIEIPYVHSSFAGAFGPPAPPPH